MPKNYFSEVVNCSPTVHLFRFKECCSDGAQRWDRTTDTRIFSPLLYQLSYLGKLGQRIICKNEDNVINQSNDLNPSAFA